MSNTQLRSGDLVYLNVQYFLESNAPYWTSPYPSGSNSSVVVYYNNQVQLQNELIGFTIRTYTSWSLGMNDTTELYYGDLIVLIPTYRDGGNDGPLYACNDGLLYIFDGAIKSGCNPTWILAKSDGTFPSEPVYYNDIVTFVLYTGSNVNSGLYLTADGSSLTSVITLQYSTFGDEIQWDAQFQLQSVAQGVNKSLDRKRILLLIPYAGSIMVISM